MMHVLGIIVQNYYEDDDIFRLIAVNYSNPTVGFHNRLTHRNYDQHQKMKETTYHLQCVLQ